MGEKGNCGKEEILLIFVAGNPTFHFTEEERAIFRKLDVVIQRNK
jgi:hypothetical protein